jgi:threonine dehydratase
MSVPSDPRRRAADPLAPGDPLMPGDPAGSPDSRAGSGVRPSRVPPADAPSAAAPVGLVPFTEIQRAAERLHGVVLRTPLLPFGPPLPADPLGRTRAYLKPESLQPIGAFKLRGAYNAIASLPPERRAAGVVAHSSGNHARGVSRAALLLGVRAVIVMPTGAPAVKVAGVRADGAEIVFVGASSEERAERAAELARQDGMSLVPSYDHPAIIAGQGTVGLEIAEQLAELDARPRQGSGGPLRERMEPASAKLAGSPPVTVLVPVGGGGLASGIVVAVKALLPQARIVGVEPALAADARDSVRAGRVVRWEPELVARTSADGMRTVALSPLTFAHLARYVEDIVTVEEIEIARAMARAAREARLVLEPSGATALAAWLFHSSELPEEGRVVCVLSGGNVDPDRYSSMLREGEAAGA